MCGAERVCLSCGRRARAKRARLSGCAYCFARAEGRVLQNHLAGVCGGFLTLEIRNSHPNICCYACWLVLVGCWLFVVAVAVVIVVPAAALVARITTDALDFAGVQF